MDLPIFFPRSKGVFLGNCKETLYELIVVQTVVLEGTLGDVYNVLLDFFSAIASEIPSEIMYRFFLKYFFRV